MIWTSSSLPSGGEKSLVHDAFHDPGANARLPNGVQTVSVMFAMPFANQSPKGERQGLCLCSPQRGWDRRCAESYRGTVPVYGSDDAPASWRMMVVNFLSSHGFVRNLVERCWWMRFDAKGRNESQALIEVDDFIIGARPEIQASIKKIDQDRFDIGKWEEDGKLRNKSMETILSGHRYRGFSRGTICGCFPLPCQTPLAPPWSSGWLPTPLCHWRRTGPPPLKVS